MVKCHNQGTFIKNNKILTDQTQANNIEGTSKHKKQTMAYQILAKHNQQKTQDDQNNQNDQNNQPDLLKLKFDALTSHDITYVGIIQTVRAAFPDFEKFPVPYVLTNCHNSLCAVGGTTNEDDHVFGLSAAKKYGGIYVPPHIAVIHQYMREQMAGCGKMILGSDSHTRYGALGTMGFGEGGGELVKQILGRTYDIPLPEVTAIYLTGTPRPGVGPQDVALALIGKVFESGIVKNKILEFVGPGVENLSVEYRIGIDVMTTETACLSSIWTTDSKVEEYYHLHGRAGEYSKMEPGDLAYYDDLITIELDKIAPMIAMPFHPSNVYTIEDAIKNAGDIGLPDIVDQGIIAGCAGGLYESICQSAEILDFSAKCGGDMLDAFSLSVYPASQPMYLTMVETGVAAKLMKAGVVLKTAFCGPCFGAGDVPKNNGFSLRHTTRNFPNREGSKPSLGQSASVALMDALSIAATAANGGKLTAADSFLSENFSGKLHIPAYYFNGGVYEKRVYDGYGNGKGNDPSVSLVYAPGIRDWPELAPMAENMLLYVASYITDAVTTTDELIPSGETSSFRSNPYALAEYTLSRKDPGYVDRAKTVASQKISNLRDVHDIFPVDHHSTALGSVIYANKPGDGSAREQAASCQRVLGGLANIATEYATKRYRSNLINWGMLPFLIKSVNSADFALGDYIYIPGIKDAVQNHQKEIPAHVISVEKKATKQITLEMGPLTDDERDILLAGCLINYYRADLS